MNLWHRIKLLITLFTGHSDSLRHCCYFRHSCESRNPVLRKEKSRVSLLFRILPILAAFTVGISSAWALPADAQKAVSLRADSVEIFHKKGLGFYRGHVELDQGTTHLRTDQAKTIHNANNTLLVAIAYGKGQELAHYWTIPKENEPEVHAYADTIYYYPQQKKIILKGQARFTQGENNYTAPEIIYDMVQAHVFSPNNRAGRTTIVWHQDPKKGSLLNSKI